jgi:carbohydrate kinase (thermoresistant glucokinase family)
MEVIIVMGVSGSGKSTIGRLLAGRLAGTFLDADDFHPESNIDKMAAGIGLADQDRFPWLNALVDELKSRETDPQPLVLACSALKRAYRDVFRRGFPHQLRFVYLRGEYSDIIERMRSRRGHFMKASMLQSQFADLEPPEDAITVGISGSPDKIVEAILAKLTAGTSQD